MKKIISVFLVFILLFFYPCSAASAQNISYTNEEKRLIYLKYKEQERMLDGIFNNDNAVGYWNLIHNIEKEKMLKSSIDLAAVIIGEYPDEKTYTEILTNFIVMQNEDIAEQVQTQSQWDDLKDGMDYAKDIVEIVTDFIGGGELLETLSPVIDATTDGIDVLVDNAELAKYYETIIRDYSQSKLFLEAVKEYAADKILRSVAKSLLEANEQLLNERLKYISDSMELFADYEVTFIMEHLSFDLLKSTDVYKNDDTIEWFVDCGENLYDTVSLLKSEAHFAFHMVMLIGNIGFGTEDTFNRYQEMKAISDIASAIVKANSQIEVLENTESFLS